MQVGVGHAKGECENRGARAWARLWLGNHAHAPRRAMRSSSGG